MIITRYSNSGFKPQFQKYHLEYLNYLVFKSKQENCPEHLWPYIKEHKNQMRNFLNSYYLKFFYGIWVFINGFEDFQSLNHLKEIPKKHIGEIPDYTMVFGVGLDKIFRISDPQAEIFGCYIPAESVKYITIME